MNDNLKFTGMYRAKVLDNNDLEMLGRIKAEVYPMLISKVSAQNIPGVDGIDLALLPWAVPALPISSGAGNGCGSFAVPGVDSFVFIFFEAGDINQPVYFAEAQTKLHGLPASRVTSYPNRKVVETAGGIKIILDDTTGKVIITGAGDVVVQGANVRINPLSPVE